VLQEYLGRSNYIINRKRKTRKKKRKIENCVVIYMCMFSKKAAASQPIKWRFDLTHCECVMFLC